jgi:hypothetical protein
MKNLILSKLEQPVELEKLYRKNKSEFKASFNSVYSEIRGKGNADYWHARLNFESDPVQWGKISDWKFMLLLAAIAWPFAKIPFFFNIDEDIFYPRNLSFFIFPLVGAYFARLRRQSFKDLLVPCGIILISLIYINILPQSSTGDTLILACIHLPLLLWGVLGIIFTEKSPNAPLKRLGYLQFTVDAIIMGAVLVISGMLLSGVTIALFSLIGLNIEDIFFSNFGVFGLLLAPMIVSHLTQFNPQLVNKIPSIIAKIFSPLVLIMLVFYLGAILFAGKDPYNDREFLLIFNLLLIGVMGLIFYSLTESSGEKSSNTGKWILTLLSFATIIVNLVALSAIGFRISEWGFTPNRLAILGINVLMLIHLVIVFRKLILVITRKEDHSLNEVTLIVVRYLPIYLLWSALVVFLFPMVFAFE